MAKILINEQHIRKIVKETLENLLLGEEPNTMTSAECAEMIKTMKLNGIDTIEFEDDDKGNATLLFSNQQTNEEYFVEIYFYLDGNHEEYDPGDYMTEPSGGIFSLNSVIPTCVKIMNYDNEFSAEIEKSTPEFKFFYKLINRFSGEIESSYNENYDSYDYHENQRAMYDDRI